MKCPECSNEIPGRELVCGECGAYVYRDVPAVSQTAADRAEEPVRRAVAAAPVRPDGPYRPGPGGPDFVYPTLHGWPGLAPEPGVPGFGDPVAGAAEGSSRSSQLPSASQVAEALREEETRRRGRTIGRWSVGLAILAVLLPIMGVVGVVTGVMAWKLGETRLGRIGVGLSIVAMLAGLALALALDPAS